MASQGGRADVHRLLDAIGVPDLGYAEIRDAERCAAARGALITGAPAVATPAGARPRASMSRLPVPLVAIVAPAPEVGRATVVANLVHQLAHGEAAAVAFDLDPAGDLERFARASTASVFVAPLALVPLAALAESAHADGDAAATLFAQMRTHLASGAALAFALPPAGDGPLLGPVLAAAWRVLAVATPSQPVPAIEAFDRLLIERGGPEPTWLINRFDARHAAHRDHLAALRAGLAGRVLPHVVHDDAEVARLAARGALVANEAGDSQVAAEIGAIADWIRAGAQHERDLGN